MDINRKGNELVIKFPPDIDITKLQDIIDYLRYEELTANSSVSTADVEDFVKKAKNGRWNRLRNDFSSDE